MTLLVIAGAGPAVAGPGPAANYFGAIAVELPTHHYGWSTNYPTRAGAQHRAMHECHNFANVPSNCQLMVWVKNGCAAVAYKSRPSGGYKYGWGIGSSKLQAKQHARAAVGAGAIDLVALCTVH